MVSVRTACSSDIEGVSRMIAEFNTRSLAKFGLGFSVQDATELATKLIATHVALLLVEVNGESEKIVGGIGGTIVPSMMNSASIVFTEIFFYVDQEYRKYSAFLLETLENKCIETKVDKIIMANMNDENFDKLARFYSMKGYQLLEQHYIKGV